MGYLHSVKRKGFVLITTLLFALIISLLTMNLLAAQSMQHKMQQNYQSKQFSMQQAENELVKAENTLKKRNRENDNNYYWQTWQPCPRGKCYLITARGEFDGALTVLQEIYMLEFATATEALHSYHLGWWPVATNSFNKDKS